MNAGLSGGARAAILSALVLACSDGWAMGDQWYLGFGAGASILDPTSEDDDFEIDENVGTTGSLFLGSDLDETTSVQVQLHSLGTAELSDGDEANYFAGDASVLYRFIDSRDFAPRGTVFGASLYGRFGLGVLERDSSRDLDRDAPIFFGAGAGVELYLTRNLALRAEGVYLDRDASTFGLSLVGRFGGRRSTIGRPAPPVSRTFRSPTPTPSTSSTPARPPIAADPTLADPVPADAPLADPTLADPVPADAPLADPTLADPVPADAPLADPTLADPQPEETVAELPEVYVPPDVQGDLGNRGEESIPATAETQPPTPQQSPTLAGADRDVDGVRDEIDECPNSTPGFPVLDNGCPMLEGVLSGIRFEPNSAELLPGSREQLDILAGVLERYPDARIELKAYTDASRDERTQSILTRARLRAVGTYLVLDGGISARRLHLRSFGSADPIASNQTESGRRTNNRFEISEYTR